MKKITSLILSLVMLITCVLSANISAYAYVTKCDNLKYIYDYENNKTLYIQGKGTVPEYYLGFNHSDYLESVATNPFTDGTWGYKLWMYPDLGEPYVVDVPDLNRQVGLQYMPGFYYEVTRHVENLVIEEGITKISDGAFSCTFDSLKTLQLPSTLKTIGYAFTGHIHKPDTDDFTKREPIKIVVPSNVQKVDVQAFKSLAKSVAFLGKKTKVDFGGKSKNAIHRYFVKEFATIYCYPDSEIAKQCKKYGKSYKTFKKPSTPGSLKSSDVTVNSAKLTWSKTKNASYYQIFKYDSKKKKYKYFASTSKTSYQLKKLSSATTYKFKVRGVNNESGAKFYGKCFPSYAKFTTNPSPTDITGITGGSKKITVKWKKNTARTSGYQIKYSTSSDFANPKYITISNNKTTSKTIKNLKGNKLYYFRVRTYKTVEVNGKSKRLYSTWSDPYGETTKK